MVGAVVVGFTSSAPLFFLSPSLVLFPRLIDPLFCFLIKLLSVSDAPLINSQLYLYQGPLGDLYLQPPLYLITRGLYLIGVKPDFFL